MIFILFKLKKAINTYAHRVEHEKNKRQKKNKTKDGDIIVFLLFDTVRLR